MVGDGEEEEDREDGGEDGEDRGRGRDGDEEAADREEDLRDGCADVGDDASEEVVGEERSTEVVEGKGREGS